MIELFNIAIPILKTIIIVFMILSFVPVMIWMERKGAAYIQDRRGPNRANIFGIRLGGLIHSFADSIKLFTKEEITNKFASKKLFYIAPAIAFIFSIITIAVVPFAEPIEVFGYIFNFQIANIEPGLIYVFAMSSLSVYALLIAGWASCGKFSLLGSLRASSQMISYELSIGLAVIGIFLLTGSFRLNEIVMDQGPSLWTWNIIRQPLAFIIFLTAMFAETNRLPFDLPESESELVAGYHTEYSSMRFALFFMAEYTHIIVGSLVIATIFLSGWNIPFISSELINDHSHDILFYSWIILAFFMLFIGGLLIKRFKRRYKDLRDFETVIIGSIIVIIGLILLISWSGLFSLDFFRYIPEYVYTIFVFFIQVLTLLTKAFCFCVLFIWVRWTLPRFRYDQLMKLGWKVMLPLGILNIVITAGVIVFLT